MGCSREVGQGPSGHGASCIYREMARRAPLLGAYGDSEPELPQSCDSLCFSYLSACSSPQRPRKMFHTKFERASAHM